MELKDTFTNRAGQVVKIVYSEDDPLSGLEGKILQGVHTFCFCSGKLVIVYDPSKSCWLPPGGAIDPGETYENAIIREVAEETNMRVVQQKFIGYQDIYEPTRIIRQIRSFCVVEPIGPFHADPGGDITEIKLIDLKDYKQYFDWGKIGDRIMSRAMEMYAEYKAK